MDIKPRRQGSIDGFIQPKHNLQPRIRPIPQPSAKLPTDKTPTPKLTPPQRSVSLRRDKLDASPFQSSLIGTSLPNRAFEKARPEPALKTKSKKHNHSKKWYVVRSSLAAVVLLAVLGGWLGFKFLGNVNKVFHGSIFSDAHALFSQTKLNGESQGRVNILLAGDSSDDPGHAGADLTDSIMLLSINTKNHSGFMLSIPRDTWVDVPGMGHEKINDANTASNFSEAGYPSGGMGQLQEIITNNFGIPIDYSALINYTAFRDAVNAVGGITINIQSSNPRGLFDAYTNLKLPNGEVTLNGQQALDLARARGDDSAGDTSYGFPDSDYDRTEHQRQMLVALEQKATSAGVLSNPLKITQLFDAAGNNINTDLTVADTIRLSQITKGLNLSNMQSLTLSDQGSNPLLKNYTAPDGEDALIPADGVDDFSQIQQYYESLTSNSGSTVNGVAAETPSVVVLNASDVDGLARKEATTLQTAGFNVVGVTDANGEYPDSMIVDLTNDAKPASRTALQKLFSSDTTLATSSLGSGESSEAHGYTADFVVILGKNWDPGSVAP